MAAHLKDHDYCALMSGSSDGVQAKFPRISSELEDHNYCSPKPNSLRTFTPSNSDESEIDDAGQPKMVLVCLNGNKNVSQTVSQNSTAMEKQPGSLPCLKANCKRKFRDEVLRQRHMKEAHTYACHDQNCAGVYYSRKTADRHYRIAHNEAFKCKVKGCNKTFKGHRNLYDHWSNVHLRYNNEVLRCKEVGCNKTFFSWRNAHAHWRFVHNNEIWTCKVEGCNKTFKWKGSMRLHQKTKHRAESLQFKEVTVEKEILENEAGMEMEAVFKMESTVEEEDTVVEEITFVEEEGREAEDGGVMAVDGEDDPLYSVHGPFQ